MKSILAKGFIILALLAGIGQGVQAAYSQEIELRPVIGEFALTPDFEGQNTLGCDSCTSVLN